MAYTLYSFYFHFVLFWHLVVNSLIKISNGAFKFLAKLWLPAARGAERAEIGRLSSPHDLSCPLDPAFFDGETNNLISTRLVMLHHVGLDMALGIRHWALARRRWNLGWKWRLLTEHFGDKRNQRNNTGAQAEEQGRLQMFDLHWGLHRQKRA